MEKTALDHFVRHQHSCGHQDFYSITIDDASYFGALHPSQEVDPGLPTIHFWLKDRENLGMRLHTEWEAWNVVALCTNTGCMTCVSLYNVNIGKKCYCSELRKYWQKQKMNEIDTKVGYSIIM